MEPFRNSTGGKNVTYNLILTSVEFAVVLASFILSVIPEKLPYVTTDESLVLAEIERLFFFYTKYSYRDLARRQRRRSFLELRSGG